MLNNPVLSVSELNEYVNLLFQSDENLSALTVCGEISGFKRHISGHLYFTLKDEQSSVKVVMFKYNALRLNFFPKDGMSIEIQGHVGLYGKDGSFQVYADSMSKTGEGDLFKRFIAYKNELEQRGWFDASNKKALPFLPRSVGVVTSASGAAIEDIRKVIGRRFPNMPILLYAASVQGKDAAYEIARAVERADAEHKCDVLIVGRGGGSLEDLWAFNEPEVAEAIYNCSLPVISAVGHEIDFSISDFVADVRAATPSAAAELAVPEYSSIKENLLSVYFRLENSLKRGLIEKRNDLELIYQHPAMRSPMFLFDKFRQRLDTALERLSSVPFDSIQQERMRLCLCKKALSAFSPDGLLAKGFIMASEESGKRITSARSLHPGDPFCITFIDGKVRALTESVDYSAEVSNER